MAYRGKIVILTGAGISAESGLGTFRDKDGLWTKYDLNDVATPEGFARNPQLVTDFYNARRGNALEATPNAAHLALTELQTRSSDEVVIVTQNVDDLHERAGSTVIHMHGELMGALCHACGHRWRAPRVMDVKAPCPACGAPATRPDVVWFGEIPYFMEVIAEHLQDCTLFAAIAPQGKSIRRAGFVQEAALYGAETVELNLDQSDMSPAFNTHIQGRASEVVPRWVEELLS